MAKQLNFTMNIDANISKAKKQIDDLHQALQKLSATKSGGLGPIKTEDIKKASAAAKELQKHLQEATDVNTGRINLSTLSNSFKKAGKDLDYFRDNIKRMGPAGEEVFLKFSRSVATSEAPVKRVNERIKELAVSLKNTARWQLSSSVLHGFMGSLQKAYGYAKDLDRSLNEIRIVTGSSAEEMAKFARNANLAAKELSTSTTNYTDAALIFFQQGLDEKDVVERTNAVIKMSNVTRESAEQVSSYMTAIWNNFDDGSKKLEYHADVITALGAATASSSKEIAGGLEKFVAIGKQIGLSYEYATSALATVVAQTRQSEEVVGTSFKTIFARMQGLELGETLEDGTSLNKYSEALQAVGVSIKDASGELKDMDDILDDLGSKWGSLSRDVQVATAQTVAGIRQYNQLVSLMQNWDVFKDNLSIAKNSEGALQRQFDIFEEGWEASGKRLTATLQETYSEIVDKDTFIFMTEAVTKFADGVAGLVKGLGGLKGILLTVAGIITQKLAKEAPVALNRFKESFMIISGVARKNADSLRSENIKNIEEERRNSSSALKDGSEANPGEIGYLTKVTGLEKLAKKKQEYFLLEDKLNSAQKQAYAEEIKALELTMALLEQKGELILKNGQQLEDNKNRTESKLERLSVTQEKKDSEGNVISTRTRQFDASAFSGLIDASKKLGQANTSKTIFDSLRRQSVETKKDMTGLAASIEGVFKSFLNGSSTSEQRGFWSKQISELKKLNSEFKNGEKSVEDYGKALKEKVGSGEVSGKIQEIIKWLKELEKESSNEIFSQIDNADISNKAKERLRAEIGSEIDSAKGLGSETANAFVEIQQFSESGSDAAKMLKKDFSESVVSAVGALSSLSGLLYSLEGAFRTFSDSGASNIQIFSAGIAVLTTAVSAYSAISKVAVIDNFRLAASKMAVGVASKFAAAEVGQLTAAVVGFLTTTVILAVVAAAFFAITKAVQYLIQKVKAADRAFEDMGKAAAQMKKDFEDAKKSFEELKNSISNYESAEKGLKALTKGTQEYKDALKQANEEAQKIISGSNGALKEGEHYSIDDGRVIFKKGALENYQKEKEDSLNKDQAAATVAGYHYNQESSKRKLGDLFNGGISDAGKSILLDTRNLKGLSGEALDKAIQDIASNITFLKDEKKKQFSEILKEKVKNDSAYDSSFRLIASQTLSRDDRFKNSNDKENYLNFSANQSQAGYRDRYDDYLKRAEKRSFNWWQLGLEQIGTKESNEMLEKFYAAKGISKENFRLEDSKSDGEFKVSLKNESGKWEEPIKVTAKEIAEKLAGIDVPDLQREAFENFSNVMDKFEKAGKGGLSAIFGGDVSSLKLSDVNGIDAELQGRGAFEQTYKSTIGEDFWASNFNLTNQQIDERIQEISKLRDEFNTLAQSYNIKNFGQDLIDQMGIGDAKKWRDTFSKIDFGPAGEEISFKLNSFVKDGLNSISDIKDREKAFSALADIDWSSWDAVSQAQGVIKTFGGDINSFSTAINGIDGKVIKATHSIGDFEKQLRKATGAKAPFEELAKTMSSLAGIVGKLSFGSVINEKDYAILIGYKESLKDLFITLEDGSKKFIGSKTSVRDELLGNLSDARENIRERAKASKLLNEQDWQRDGESIDFSTYTEDRNKEEAMANLSTYADKLDDSVLAAVGATKEKLMELSNEGSAISDENYKLIEEFFANLGKLQHENSEEALRLNEEQTAAFAENITQLKEMQSEGAISEETFQKYAFYQAQNAKTLEELDAIAQNSNLTNEQMGSVLVKLAEQYDNCTEEVQRYKEALCSGSKQAIASAAEELHLAVTIGEASKRYNLNAKEVESYSKTLRDSTKYIDANGKAVKYSAEEAAAMAVANTRLDRGLLSLNKNLKDYNKSLSQNEKGTAEWSRIAGKMKADLADILNFADESQISDAMLEAARASKHFQGVLDGNAESILQLRLEIADGLHKEIVETLSDAGGLSSRYMGIWNELKSLVSQDLTSGDFDAVKIMNRFNELIEAGKLTKEQIESTMAGLNIAADLEVTYNKMYQETPVQSEYTQTEILGEPKFLDGGNGLKVLSEPGGWKRKTFVINEDPIIAEQSVPVYKIKGGKDARGNTTSTVKKLGKPSASYGSTRNAVLENSKSPSRKKAKGKGKSKSEGKSKSKSKSGKPYEKQIYKPERYKETLDRLESVLKAYEKIVKASERAFGKKKISLINKEIAALKRLNVENKKFIRELDGQIKLNRNKIYGYGGEFDKDGNITNYNKVRKKLFDQAEEDLRRLEEEKNKAIEKAGDEGLSEEEERNFEKRRKKIEDRRKGEDETFANYDADIKTRRDKQEEIVDNEREIIDKGLGKLSYVIQLKTKVDDSAIEELERKIKRIEDAGFDAAKTIALLGEGVNKKVEFAETNINVFKKVLKDNYGFDYDENSKEEDKKKRKKKENSLIEKIANDEDNAIIIETLEETITNQKKVREEIEEFRSRGWEDIKKDIDEYAEKFNKIISSVISKKEIADNFRNIIDIVGIKPLGILRDFVKDLNQQSLNQANNIALAKKNAYESAKIALEELQKISTKNMDDIAKKRLEDTIEGAKQHVMEAEKEFNDAWKNSLEEANRVWEENVRHSIEMFKDGLKGAAASFEDMQNEFNRKNERDNLYVEDYEKIYNLTKLTRDINKSIDESKNIASKQALLKLSEEIAKSQNDGKKITQYELDLLAKKYELKKAELALDESAKAKSSVSLVRDENGKQNYVYTADKDSTAKAEQDYENRLYEMQKLNTDYIKNLQNEIVQAQAQAAEEIAKIKQSDYASYTEWQDAVKKVQEHYNEKIKFYYDQLELGLSNNRILYEEDWKFYSERTGYKISDEQNFIDKFTESNLSIATGFQDRTTAEKAWTDSSAALLKKLEKDYEDWQTNVDSTMGLAETSMTDFKTKVKDEFEEVNKHLKTGADQTTGYKDSATGHFKEVSDSIVSLEQIYTEKYGSIKTTLEGMIQLYERIADAAAKAAAAEAGVDGKKNSKKGGGKNNSKKGGGSNKNNETSDVIAQTTSQTIAPINISSKSENKKAPKSIEEGIAAAIWLQDNANWGNGGNRRSKFKEAGLTDNQIKRIQSFISSHGPTGKFYSLYGGENDVLSKYEYSNFIKGGAKFDTGGYTGKWNSSEGRLAVLHQKELVLNAADTENILSVVNIVRKIAETIDLNAAAARGALSSIVPAGTIPNNSRVVEQKVQITAEFPNATNHSEIEEAFNNLINTASQYAGRRK